MKNDIMRCGEVEDDETPETDSDLIPVEDDDAVDEGPLGDEDTGVDDDWVDEDLEDDGEDEDEEDEEDDSGATWGNEEDSGFNEEDNENSAGGL